MSFGKDVRTRKNKTDLKNPRVIFSLRRGRINRRLIALLNLNLIKTPNRFIWQSACLSHLTPPPPLWLPLFALKSQLLVSSASPPLDPNSLFPRHLYRSPDLSSHRRFSLRYPCNSSFLFCYI